MNQTFQVQGIFDSAQKTQLQKELLTRIFSEVDNKRVSFSDLQTSAGYIIDQLERVQDYNQTVAFLNDLKLKWPFYKDLYTIYQGKITQQKEKEIIDRLASYIKTMD